MSEQGSSSSWFDVRPQERRIAGLMGAYFFLVITTFWILKPLKKTFFIGHYADSGFLWLGESYTAPEAELLAKVMNMVVAAAAATVFTLAARRFRRQQLTYAFTSFFLIGYLLFAIGLQQPTGTSVWSFYLFGDLFSTLMVATFFSFLNDSVSPDSAKRLYGVIGFGGVAGGVFGSSAMSVWIGSLTLGWWLTIAGAIGLAILVLAYAAARTIEGAHLQAPAAQDVQGGTAAEESSTTPSRSPLAGARLVFRSSYLTSIVAIVGLYELVSTILDFQFTSAVFEFTSNEEDRNQHYATIFAVTNWLSMFVQIFLTSFVMRRFGLATALLLLPLAIAFSSLGFFLFPTLLMGSLLSISDNGFSYSINQSSKEALYVPTTVEEKYQAKAFIDMFVQRFAKALGVGLGLVVKKSFVGFAGISSLSLFILPVLALWGFAALHAGRRFKQLEESNEA